MFLFWIFVFERVCDEPPDETREEQERRRREKKKRKTKKGKENLAVGVSPYRGLMLASVAIKTRETRAQSGFIVTDTSSGTITS